LSEQFFIQDFKIYKDNPNTIRASIGWLYGLCARQLHYSYQFGLTVKSQSDIDAMNYGIEKHKEIQEKWLATNDNWIAEMGSISRILPSDNKFGLPDHLTCSLDLVNLKEKSVIEIKPMYDRKAYIQTLLQKYLFKDFKFHCLEYLTDNLIPLKADYNMARIYLIRVLTSLIELPPRFPNSNYNHSVCLSCPFREICYSDDLDSNTKESWQLWTLKTKEIEQEII